MSYIGEIALINGYCLSRTEIKFKLKFMMEIINHLTDHMGLHDSSQAPPLLSRSISPSFPHFLM